MTRKERVLGREKNFAVQKKALRMIFSWRGRSSLVSVIYHPQMKRVGRWDAEKIECGMKGQNVREEIREQSFWCQIFTAFRNENVLYQIFCVKNSVLTWNVLILKHLSIYAHPDSSSVLFILSSLLYFSPSIWWPSKCFFREQRFPISGQ